MPGCLLESRIIFQEAQLVSNCEVKDAVDKPTPISLMIFIIIIIAKIVMIHDNYAVDRPTPFVQLSATLATDALTRTGEKI